MSRQVIAVDFDGTLAVSAGEPRSLGILNPQIVSYMQRRYDFGDFIVVYTARPSQDRSLLTAWLAEREIPYDLLETGKLRYDLLIDDRSMRPEEVEDEARPEQGSAL